MNDDILMHVVLQVGCLIIWEREKQRNISWTNMGSCEGGGGGAGGNHTGKRLWGHKRISTSIERNQAEPGECRPAGPSQSLSPGREDRAGPGGKGRGERSWPVK